MSYPYVSMSGFCGAPPRKSNFNGFGFDFYQQCYPQRRLDYFPRSDCDDRFYAGNFGNFYSQSWSYRWGSGGRGRYGWGGPGGGIYT